MERLGRNTVSAAETRQGGGPDTAGRLDTSPGASARHANQLQPAAGTAAEPPRADADRARVFTEAANAAEAFLDGARGPQRRVQVINDQLPQIPQSIKNLQLAKQATEYVQNISKFSTTRPSHVYSQIARDDSGKKVRFAFNDGQIVLTTDKREAAQRRKMIETVRDTAAQRAKDQINALKQDDVILSKMERQAIRLRQLSAVILEMSKTIEADHLVANCVDKAMLAFDMLANKEDNPQLDVVGLQRGEPVTATAAITNERVFVSKGTDHGFLVIGRDPDSDIADPSTWGDDTVICDPWAKREYSVSAFKEEMALLSSVTNGQTRCEMEISWPANTPYNSDPTVVYREKDGIAGRQFMGAD